MIQTSFLLLSGMQVDIANFVPCSNMSFIFVIENTSNFMPLYDLSI